MIRVRLTPQDWDTIMVVARGRNEGKRAKSLKQSDVRDDLATHILGVSAEWGVAKWYGAGIDGIFNADGGDEGRPDLLGMDGKTLEVKWRQRKRDFLLQPGHTEMTDDLAVLVWGTDEHRALDIVGVLTQAQWQEHKRIINLPGKGSRTGCLWQRFAAV